MAKLRNRGKQSNDDQYFAPTWHPTFRDAADDLGHLLGRGYAPHSALQLVGNRYRLNKRQRNAIFRISASPQSIAQRRAREWSSAQVAGQAIDIDGFNLLILLESALSGAYLFRGRDGTFRDISSVHGSYKRVQKTEAAILLLGRLLSEWGVGPVHWYLDQPISNSGRLKSRLRELSEEANWDWRVDLVYSPDKVLAESENLAVSTDAWILDRAARWWNLGALIINRAIPEAQLIAV